MIEFLQIVDDNNGWAIFASLVQEEKIPTQKESFWVAHTSDGGQTWLNTTPANYYQGWRYSYGFRPHPDETLRLFAYDANTVWVYWTCRQESSCMPQRPAALWRSDDAGLFWQTLPLPCDYCVIHSLFFIDKQHGWLRSRNHAHMGHYYDRLFRTIDGGISWQELPGILEMDSTSSCPFPLFFNASEGIRWCFHSSGLFTDIQSGAYTWMERTENGGLTWTRIPVPSIPSLSMIRDALGEDINTNLLFLHTYTTSLPGLGEDVTGFRVEYKIEHKGDSVLLIAYHLSIDHGRTWKSLWNAGDSFILPTGTGWLLADTGTMELKMTQDGGSSWYPAFSPEVWSIESKNGASIIVHLDKQGTRQEILPSFLREDLWAGRGIRLEQIYMENERNGWGLEAAGYYLCTADGGNTWYPCVPKRKLKEGSFSLDRTEGRWSIENQPEELFHGQPLPDLLKTDLEKSQSLLKNLTTNNDQKEVEEFIKESFTQSFKYRCATSRIEPMDDSHNGFAHTCTLAYPANFLAAGMSFTPHHWLYSYYVLEHDGKQEIWPNVLSADFINTQTGWRLTVSKQAGLFDLEQANDGGLHWTRMKTVSWSGELEFVNEREGWVIARQPYPQGIYDIFPDLLREAVLLHTTDGGNTWNLIRPTLATALPQSELPMVSFIYPIENQTLDFNADYKFAVSPIEKANGYLWRFYQNGVLLWENLRDTGNLSGPSFTLTKGSGPHARVEGGYLQVWVQAFIEGQWTFPTIITVYIQNQ